MCVAVAESPKARAFLGRGIAEISRIASDGSTPYAASMAGGAVARAALSLGYRRLVSYTLLGEAGTTYRAMGWWPTAILGGGEWDRVSRAREVAGQAGAKVRWEAGPEALPRDADVEGRVRVAVGTIAISMRVDREPLLRRTVALR